MKFPRAECLAPLLLCGCAGIMPHGSKHPTPQALDAAAEYSEGQGGAALLVWQGKLLLERHGAGMHRTQRHHIRSIAKPIWALAVLHAEGAGFVDCAAPVSRVITEWENFPGKREITARQLLQMTSGLAPGRDLYAGTGFGVRERAVRTPLLHAPGSAFEYGGSSWEVLGLWFERSLAKHGMASEQYLQKAVFAPLGIRPPDLRRDSKGDPFFSAGMSLSSSELLLLGRQLLRRTPPLEGSKNNPAFDSGFWMNTGLKHGERREVFVEDWIGNGRSGDWRQMVISRHAPADLVTLLGSSGQRIYVSKSLGLVVVRLGNGDGFRDAEFWKRLMGG